MEEEVALERASQQVIKYLLGEQEFREAWQNEVSRILEHQQPGPSTTCHVIQSLRTAVSELKQTIEYVATTFESEVHIRNCFVSDSVQSTNRDAGNIFEAAFKVEKLAGLNLKQAEIETISTQISAACRRSNLVLKAFGKKFQSQQSIDLNGLLTTSNRLCQLFYSISSEISRFSAEFEWKDRRNDRKSVRKLSRELREAADEFNVKVLGATEQMKCELEKEKKSRMRRPRTAPECAQRAQREKAPVEIEYEVKTRRQKKMATSIQEAIVPEDVASCAVFSKRPHPPGSIATSIISKRKGFLIEDSLARARERVPRPHRKTTRTLESEHPEDVVVEDPGDAEEDVLKSAIAMTGLVIEEMKMAMKIGNDEQLFVGVGK